MAVASAGGASPSAKAFERFRKSSLSQRQPATTIRARARCININNDDIVISETMRGNRPHPNRDAA